MNKKKVCPKCGETWEGYHDESPSNHFCRPITSDYEKRKEAVISDINDIIDMDVHGDAYVTWNSDAVADYVLKREEAVARDIIFTEPLQQVCTNMFERAEKYIGKNE